MNASEPLGLPRGSVRAIITYTALLAVIAAAFLRLPTEYFTALLTLATTSVGYYMGARPKKSGEGEADDAD